MRNRTIAPLLAAALLAGTVYTASAGENAPPPFRPGIAGADDCGSGHRRRRGDRDDDWRGGRRDDDRGPGGRHRRFGGPGCDGPGMRTGGGFGPGMHMGGFGGGMWDDLELTADQKARLMDVMTENFRAGMEAKMQMHDTRRKLDELRRDDSADAEALVAANAALGEARGRMEALGRKVRDDFRSVLNEDQIKKLDERREKWDEWRTERDENRDGPRGLRGSRGPGGPGPRR